MLKLLIGIVLVLIALRIGFMILRALGAGPPVPPPEGELRRLNLRYRCSLCGTELRLTAAPSEDPVPPRHCMEEMEYAGSPDDD